MSNISTDHLAEVLRTADARARKLFGVSLSNIDIGTLCLTIAWGIKEAYPRFNIGLFIHRCNTERKPK